MQKRKVLSRRALPARAPIEFSCVLVLICDRLHVPGYVWGVLWSILALFWFAFIYNVSTETQVEPLIIKLPDDDNDEDEDAA